MYRDLPYKLKREVKRLLKQNQFIKAKDLHDAYMAYREGRTHCGVVITEDKRCVHRMRVLH